MQSAAAWPLLPGVWFDLAGGGVPAAELTRHFTLLDEGGGATLWLGRWAERQGSRGARRFCLHLSGEWLRAQGLNGRAGRGGELAEPPRQLSAQAVAWAELLLQAGADADAGAARLRCAGGALLLLAESLAERAPLPCGPESRCARLKAFLDSGAADGLELAQIAQALGCNANSLQQGFKQEQGGTIGEYLRCRRLQRAAQRLAEDGISVAQAAELAGYSNQANFATAFRRVYGISPRQMRCR